VSAHKLRRRNDRRATAAAPMQRPPPGPPGPPVQRPPTYPPAPPPPEHVGTAHIDPELAEAIAAARSNLNGQEVAEEAESMFT
jgi:hypothetical protein